MNKNDILFIFHSPHSAWGLRHRASKLPEGNTYRKFLEVLAKALDKKIISRRESQKLVEYAREGQIELAVSILEKLLEKRC